MKQYLSTHMYLKASKEVPMPRLSRGDTHRQRIGKYFMDRTQILPVSGSPLIYMSLSLSLTLPQDI